MFRHTENIYLPVSKRCSWKWVPGVKLHYCRVLIFIFKIFLFWTGCNFKISREMHTSYIGLLPRDILQPLVPSLLPGNSDKSRVRAVWWVQKLNHGWAASCYRRWLVYYVRPVEILSSMKLFRKLLKGLSLHHVHDDGNIIVVIVVYKINASNRY